MGPYKWVGTNGSVQSVGANRIGGIPVNPDRTRADRSTRIVAGPRRPAPAGIVRAGWWR